jgi:hypothetical protein
LETADKLATALLRLSNGGIDKIARPHGADYYSDGPGR